MARINVTKSFLPPIAEYEEYVAKIWESDWLTNQGPLLQEFEQRAGEYLHVSNLQFVQNGTLALQLALQALNIMDGEVITTPFSYVATTSAILWQRCKPVFVDIDPETLCIDPGKIEAAITSRTKAIMPVHVFGIPCDVYAIEDIAKKHKLKVIYDGAHAFGVSYKNESLLGRGDISICSFHATKLFHTIEGGCVIARDKAVREKLELIKRFGHNGDAHHMVGINAKATEFQAAMGLTNLAHIDGIISRRKNITELYDVLLAEKVQFPKQPPEMQYNYAYYPVLFRDEDMLHKVTSALERINVFPRRYFYPSLNTLPYLKEHQTCPVSEDIASRILCLPLYDSLEDDNVRKICEVIVKCIG